MADLIKMRRDDGKEADVHPTMVDDYKRGNFRVVDEAKPEAPKKAAKAKK